MLILANRKPAEKCECQLTKCLDTQKIITIRIVFPPDDCGGEEDGGLGGGDRGPELLQQTPHTGERETAKNILMHKNIFFILL